MYTVQICGDRFVSINTVENEAHRISGAMDRMVLNRQLMSMNKTRRSTRKYDELQSTLIETTIRLINRHGVDGMTLTHVADEVGLAPKAIAYYFKKKEQLAIASYLRGLERFENLVQACEAEPEPVQRIARLFETFFEFKRRGAIGCAGELIIPNDIRALNSDEVNEAYLALYRRIRGLCVDPDHAFLERAALNSRSHLVIAELNWTPAWLRNIFPEEYGRVGSRAADILLKGMAAPGREWSPKTLSLLDGPQDRSIDSSDESFIRAATQLINEHGYHGASVEKISAVLSLSKGAFYHRIKTKDELIIACFDSTFDFLKNAISAAEAAGENGLQRLQTLALALVQRQISGGPGILRPSAITSLPEALQNSPLGHFDRIALRLSGLISDGIADGSMRAVDPNVASHMFIAMFNMSVELPFFAPGITLEQVIDHYIRPSLSGLFAENQTSGKSFTS